MKHHMISHVVAIVRGAASKSQQGESGQQPEGSHPHNHGGKPKGFEAIWETNQRRRTRKAGKKAKKRPILFDELANVIRFHISSPKRRLKTTHENEAVHHRPGADIREHGFR